MEVDFEAALPRDNGVEVLPPIRVEVPPDGGVRVEVPPDTTASTKNTDMNLAKRGWNSTRWEKIGKFLTGIGFFAPVYWLLLRGFNNDCRKYD